MAAAGAEVKAEGGGLGRGVFAEGLSIGALQDVALGQAVAEGLPGVARVLGAVDPKLALCGDPGLIEFEGDDVEGVGVGSGLGLGSSPVSMRRRW